MRPLAVIALFVFSLSALAQGGPTLDARAVDKLMNATLKAWQIPGAAVAIVRNDRVVYVQGYGVKELGGNAPVTPETLFQIASTSKAFTTTLMAMLVAEGKLSWDDPVKKHVPYFRVDDLCTDSQVTLRDLVSHRTGLGRHDELWDNTPLTREQVIRAIGETKLARPFRSGYGYHNINFIAAGEAVASAAGVPWEQYVKTRLFTPLGMTRTVTADADWNADADRATGYRWEWRAGRVSPQRPIETETLGSAGAIKSSARDMGNWVRFQLANGAFDLHQLIEPAALDETKTPHTVLRLENSSRDLNPDTHVMSYGLGWTIQDYRGELLVSHSGALNGFRTHVDLLPKRNAGFVVMANLGRGYALIALRNALADMLSGGKSSRDWNAYYLMLDRRADEKAATEKAERLAKRLPDTTPTLPLASYAGEYQSRSHGKATLTVADGKLVLGWNRLSIPLTHYHYDTFTAESELDDVDEQVTFTLNGRREVEALSLFGQRFEKRQPARTGR
ncbi:MAG TPA: serine hydrolase [Thermoanaerobaculia bacterium]|jgi:CubicO group peptidase (beta-lactamase class C family)